MSEQFTKTKRSRKQSPHKSKKAPPAPRTLTLLADVVGARWAGRMKAVTLLLALGETSNINGEGDYGFMVTATDGDLNGGGGQDGIRIKIVPWDFRTGAPAAAEGSAGQIPVSVAPLPCVVRSPRLRRHLGAKAHPRCHAPGCSNQCGSARVLN